MNFFQSIVLAVFGLLAITAVIIFSMTSGGGGNLTFSGTFQMWGTLPAVSVSKSIDAFNNTNSKTFKVEYTEKRSDTFESDLISALAAGNGPDLVILPESLIIQNADKVLPISYESYPVRNFSDDFVDGASLFMSQDGIIAMPLYVDPLVMFWNKDIFSTGGIAKYPTKWSEFESLAGKLTISDQGGNVTQSAVALGTYSNIQYAKDILAALFLQAGNDIVRFSKQGELDSYGSPTKYKVMISDRFNATGPESALKFFLDFSNPAKNAYSWNVALPNSGSAFAGGTLATYFGHASDYGVIRKSNPHLNFDAALFPQRDGDKIKTTLGNFYGVAVTKGTKQPNYAQQIAINMSGADFSKSLSDAIGLPPARRDLLSSGTSDPVASVFYSSAIMSRSWLDPMPSESDQAFKEMVGTVLSGAGTEAQAVSIVGQKLTNLVAGNR